jgi:hypothetical protein
MNTLILIANILTLLAFVVHTFVGDKELKVNEPTNETDDNFQKREKWTMARCGWHWISFDLLFATIGLGLINFTNYFCIEPLFPGQFRCLKLVGLSFYRVTVLDFLSRPIPVFFCPTNHAF